MKKYFLLSILFPSFVQINFAQGTYSLPENRDPNKCYASCIVIKPKVLEEAEIASFYEYLGDDLPQSVEEETFLMPAKIETIKTKKSEDCPDSDITCFVYCYSEKAAYKKTFKTVSDTNKVKNFQLTVVYDEIFISKNMEREWFEVLCESKINNYKIKELCSKLKSKGYKIPMADFEELTFEKIKTVLYKYQQENNLPVGSINAPTLASLALSSWL